MAASRILLLLLPLFFSLPSFCRTILSTTTETDAQSLLELKNSITRDPSGLLSSWSVSDNFPCSPPYPVGITCNQFNRVTKIDLSTAGLIGHLPFSALSSLDMLQYLDLSGNTFSGNVSDLAYFSCGNLQSIKLSGNILEGTIPQKLLACGGIKELDLSHNKLTGILPQDFFSGCDNLQALYLSDNRLSGFLPPGLGQCLSLQRLDFSSNHFGGALPVDFPSNLQILDLSLNNFTGSIPDIVFSNCSSFISVDLSSNKFSGKIPPSLQKCTSLQMLNLSVNQLSDQIPVSLGNLPNIQKLYISNNHLIGPLSNELGVFCSTLLELDLSINNITGTIPPSFANCSRLQTLNLAGNRLSGAFPGNVISHLQSLNNLLLAFNSFSGSFPVAVTNCSSLKLLDLSSNSLNGILPDEICPPNFQLEELYIPNNHFSGVVPVALSNCSKLRVLDLSFNHLTGVIPAELSLLKELETASMWFNGLSGQIPRQVGSITNLRNLILNNNYLTGSIPVEITNCSRLEWLSLTSNMLTGGVPAQVGKMKTLTLLELGNNSLTGSLPVQLGQCINLLWLDINSNYLTGPIPPRLGRLASGPPENRTLGGDVFAFVRNKGVSCRSMGTLVDTKGIPDSALSQTPLLQVCNSTTLYNNRTLTSDPDFSSIQYLDLSYNFLHGNIPEEMGYSHALEVLDLAHNELTGRIPSSFSQLRYIGLLDLSYNKLEGGLWPLGNCTFLVEMDLSNNNFSGPIPSSGQLFTAPASSFANNPGLCDGPLSPCSSHPNSNTSGQAPCSRSCNRPLALLSWANCIVLGILVAIACFCSLVVWAIIVRARNKKKEGVLLSTLQSSCNGISTWNLSTEKEPLSINVATFERALKKLTFSQLIDATNGFSPESLIGTGGFGEVYKAELKDGSTVAIKKLLQFSFQGDREFVAEMETLGKIKHQNLVPLLGYCKVGEERLLVYDYMHGGSLDEMLHANQAESGRLNWEQRKQIAKGAARGLAFLHHNCIPHIIHRDMKSSNVLLDKDLEPRVSDFGMARLISALDTHLSVSTLAGTPGYVPPEYYQSFRCTTKGDIYSFGVILLELLTGKRPTDKEEFEDSNLVGWVKLYVSQNRSMEVLDPELMRSAGPSDRSEMLQYLRIACDCLDDLPYRRPTMLQVVAVFKELVFEQIT